MPVYYIMQNRKNLIVQTRENPQDHSKMEFGDKNNLETAQYLKNEIFPGYAVFARCSQKLSFNFMPSFGKIL